MTIERRKELTNQLVSIIMELTETDSTADNEKLSKNIKEIETNSISKVDMLTIKECTQVISGLSEHTVRQLVAQNKVKYIRTGQSKRGKILVNKNDLLKYFS